MAVTIPSNQALPVHLNPALRGRRPSATLAINERCAQLVKQGRQIYRLGFGQSPFPVPPSAVAALREQAAQRSYLPVKGLAELRTAVAQFHQRYYDLPAESEDILIGPGSKELIFLAQFVYHGDLIIPAPSWVSYEPQARLLGQPAQRIPTRREDGWRLRPEDLDKLCRDEPERPRLLILNYPNNPTGLSYREDELQALAHVARRHRLLIISDEIYGELHHAGRHVSLARFYPEGTIVSSGLSKWCGAGGWRLGTCCFPRSLRWLLDAVAAVASETFSTVAAPIQYAAITAYERDSQIERYLFQSRRILRALGRLVSRRLQSFGLETPAPEGGFYLFLDFTPHAAALRARGMLTSPQLCERLLMETGVALLPGADFGRPPEEFTCRLAYVDFDGGRCLEAAAEIADDQELSDDFLRRHCARVLTAIDLIGDWLAAA